MTFEKLQSLVARLTAPPAPPLYKKIYGVRGDQPLQIQNWGDWLKLPLLDKDMLLNIPFQERIFASAFKADHIRVSSGTSGKLPLFCPRTYLRGMEYRLRYHDFKKPILAFGVPAMPHWHEFFQHSLGYTPRVIVFDPKNAAASVRLARIAGADSMSLFTFHIPLIGEYMRKENINERIRFIEIAGEACTRAMFEYMRNIFPNAIILPFYGSSEVEDSPIGMPCHPITGEKPLAVYHAKTSHYHELIDPESGASIESRLGAEGELVISAYPGEPSAFPLIRYRTGDMIRIVEENCKKHSTWTFTILGRVAMDFLKIPGGVLRADEMERILRLFPNEISDEFELHRFEHTTSDGPKIEAVLYVRVRKNDINLDKLAAKIASLFRVNPQRTYAEGIIEGLYLPLACRPLNSAATGKKHKRVIAH